MSQNKSDVAIIGAGAAGCTAALYASRYGLKTLIFGELLGGTATMAHLIENYPGVKKVSGIELMKTFQDQAISFGAELVSKKVSSVGRSDDGFKIQVEDGEYLAKKVVLATGNRRRKLNIPGEKELLGKGVSYCATCDGPFFRNKTVAVIGGGDSAVTAALMLAEYAKKVYVIHRRESFTAETAWVQRMSRQANCQALLGYNILSVSGKERVEAVTLDKSYEGQTDLAAEGLFIEIGSVPESELARDMGLNLNAAGRIEVSASQETSIPGIYAAGDVTNGSNGYDQLVTATSEGAIAAHSAYVALNKK